MQAASGAVACTMKMLASDTVMVAMAVPHRPGCWPQIGC